MKCKAKPQLKLPPCSEYNPRNSFIVPVDRITEFLNLDYKHEQTKAFNSDLKTPQIVKK